MVVRWTLLQHHQLVEDLRWYEISVRILVWCFLHKLGYGSCLEQLDQLEELQHLVVAGELNRPC